MRVEKENERKEDFFFVNNHNQCWVFHFAYFLPLQITRYILHCCWILTTISSPFPSLTDDNEDKKNFKYCSARCSSNKFPWKINFFLNIKLSVWIHTHDAYSILNIYSIHNIYITSNFTLTVPCIYGYKFMKLNFNFTFGVTGKVESCGKLRRKCIC